MTRQAVDKKLCDTTGSANARNLEALAKAADSRLIGLHNWEIKEATKKVLAAIIREAELL